MMRPELGVKMNSICDGYDGIKAGAIGNILINKESLCDRGGICQAGGLNDDSIERLGAFH